MDGLKYIPDRILDKIQGLHILLEYGERSARGGLPSIQGDSLAPSKRAELVIVSLDEDTGRIAVLSLHASSDLLGGVEVFTDQLARALDRVVVFAEPTEAGWGSRWNLARVGMGQAYTAYRVAQRFRRSHREEPFALVLSNGLSGWPLTLQMVDIPMVQVYHFTLAGFARQALNHRGDRLTTRTISAFFDGLAGRGKHVIAVNRHVLREVQRFYGLDGQIILNAVDTARFKKGDRSHAREELGIDPTATVGLCVGRAQYAKGFDILVKVAKSLPEILFVFVGPAPQTVPNLRIFETVPHTEMPRFYSAADFFLLPSRYEGLNLAILEALSCDLPIVVSEAAYHLDEDPAPLGYVAGGFDPHEFVQGIHDVLDGGSSFHGRETILSSYSFDAFRENWRGLVGELVRE